MVVAGLCSSSKGEGEEEEALERRRAATAAGVKQEEEEEGGVVDEEAATAHTPRRGRDLIIFLCLWLGLAWCGQQRRLLIYIQACVLYDVSVSK